MNYVNKLTNKIKTGFMNILFKRIKTADCYIEFIGPSGVGKSTLLSKIRFKTYGNWNYSIGKTGRKKNNNDIGINGDIYWKLLTLKINNLEELDINACQKIRLLNSSVRVILNDLFIHNCNSKKGYFLEEGICHNYAKELMQLPEESFREVISGRAIIIVLPKNSNIVVDQIRRRQAKYNRIVVHHIGLNDVELKNIIECDINMLLNFSKKAEEMGISLCKLVAEDSICSNIRRILDFELRYLTNRINK